MPCSQREQECITASLKGCGQDDVGSEESEENDWSPGDQT